MSPSWFTPASARDALDWVRPAAERIRLLYLSLEERRPAVIVAEAPVDRVYFELARALVRRIDALARRGVQVKDPRAGMLDFAARRAGRPVWLCWKLGEPSLEWWHELDAGLAGRRPVVDDDGWESAAPAVAGPE